MTALFLFLYNEGKEARKGVFVVSRKNDNNSSLCNAYMRL